MKFTWILLLSLFSVSSFSATPKRYVLALFHGMGSGSSFSEDTNISEDLRMAGLEKRFNLGHDAKRRDLETVLKNFDCRNGKQNQKDLGLIIIGYSWGARASYEFSKDYFEKCGQKAERAYMLDGVQKIASQFKHSPVAKVCVSYYKTLSPIRGRALEGCENHDLTDICKMENGQYGDSWECHGKVIQKGLELAYEEISQGFLGSDLNLFIQEI